jgi:hypothetical protein
MTMYEVPDEKLPGPARAWVYAGDWVADCPVNGCGNVEYLYTPAVPNGPKVLKKPIFVCSNCGHQAVIYWPDHEMEILAILSKRPIPQNRNWFPQDHPLAVNSRVPHGQTIRDLMNENEEHGVR